MTLIKSITEGFSLVCFIIYKREELFYHDLVHKIEVIQSVIDWIYFIKARSLLNEIIF